MNHRFQKSRASARFNADVMRWGCIALLALLLAPLAMAVSAHPECLLLGSVLTGPLMLDRKNAMQFFDEFSEGDGTFESQVLREVAKVADIAKEAKKSLQEIETLRKDQSNLSALVRSIRQANLALATQRAADPIERIQSDPEKRTLFNALVRRVVNGALTGEMRRALGEDSSPGSTLVNDDLSRDIYDTLASYGAWSSLGVRQMGTKLTKLPVKTARPVANFIMSEAGTIADDTNKAGTSVNLEVEVIGVLMNVSMQLIEDAEIDVSADVLKDFAEAVSYRLDFAAFQGNGTSTGTAAKLHGGSTGIFNGGTAATADSGDNTVESLELEDFVRCLTTVDPVVLQRKAKWWMHPLTLARVCCIKDGNGRSIFQTALEAPAPGAIGSILGYPVVLAMAAPSTNTAGSKVAVFGDPDGCVVGVRNDFHFEASDHHRWNTYERSFRGIARAGVRIRRSQAFAVLTLGANPST